MRKAPAAAAFIFVLFLTVPMAYAGVGDYFKGLKEAYVRGFKNIIGAPLEIPVTIQEYHEEKGRPVLRQMAGFVDGTTQMISRAGSGLWDLAAGWIPGFQEGIPEEPETLF